MFLILSMRLKYCYTHKGIIDLHSSHSGIQNQKRYDHTVTNNRAPQVFNATLVLTRCLILSFLILLGFLNNSSVLNSYVVVSIFVYLLMNRYFFYIELIISSLFLLGNYNLISGNFFYVSLFLLYLYLFILNIIIETYSNGESIKSPSNVFAEPIESQLNLNLTVVQYFTIMGLITFIFYVRFIIQRLPHEITFVYDPLVFAASLLIISFYACIVFQKYIAQVILYFRPDFFWEDHSDSVLFKLIKKPFHFIVNAYKALFYNFVATYAYWTTYLEKLCELIFLYDNKLDMIYICLSIGPRGITAFCFFYDVVIKHHFCSFYYSLYGLIIPILFHVIFYNIKLYCDYNCKIIQERRKDSIHYTNIGRDFSLLAGIEMATMIFEDFLNFKLFYQLRRYIAIVYLISWVYFCFRYLNYVDVVSIENMTIIPGFISASFNRSKSNEFLKSSQHLVNPDKETRKFLYWCFKKNAQHPFNISVKDLVGEKINPLDIKEDFDLVSHIKNFNIFSHLSHGNCEKTCPSLTPYTLSLGTDFVYPYNVRLKLPPEAILLFDLKANSSEKFSSILQATYEKILFEIDIVKHQNIVDLFRASHDPIANLYKLDQLYKKTYHIHTREQPTSISHELPILKELTTNTIQNPSLLKAFSLKHRQAFAVFQTQHPEYNNLADHTIIYFFLRSMTLEKNTPQMPRLNGEFLDVD
jgi:hypothetical protein